MTSSLRSFLPFPADTAGVVSWIHIGDLHMTEAGEQNDLDLKKIVEEINTAFAGSVSFVYLPGDVAEHGDREAYAVVRSAIDKLRVPWCAIVGDHDVHEKSHMNFLEAMAEQTRFAFMVDGIRFIGMNAFDVPHPASFAVAEEQLDWLHCELKEAASLGQGAVIFLHCYPSDLKVGRERVQTLLREYGVMLVEMGHTHYNEVANDGHILYAATRSTGQIEEGPVGFSVTNVDEGVVSWRFFELGQLPAVMITSPRDYRLETEAAGHTATKSMRVRAKVWGRNATCSVHADFGGETIGLHRIEDSNVWQGELDAMGLASGLHALRVSADDVEGNISEDRIYISVGKPAGLPAHFNDRDQDNAIGAWPEHGLLDTQLGPNKNGRKW